MDRNEMNRLKEALKGRLPGYLERVHGVEDVKKNFCCLNPEHNDHNPSMGYDAARQRVHCFSCGANYDIFDLIGIDNGVAIDGATFPQRVKMAADFFGIAYNDAPPSRAGAKPSPTAAKPETKQATPPQDAGAIAWDGVITADEAAPEPPRAAAATPPQPSPAAATKPAKSYAKLYAYARAHAGETSYLQDRGISVETQARFNIGYWPEHGAVIIPVNDHFFVERNIDPAAPKNQRYKKHGPAALFNPDAMRNPVFFVTEGEVDAMSIEEAGGHAVALGSTSNARLLIEALNVDTGAAGRYVYLMMDNDDAGRAAAGKLADELKKAGINGAIINPPLEAKDANEALQKDREAFTGFIQNPRRAIYEERNNAGQALGGFLNGIKESVNTPCIPTGFDALDHELDGGLYEGLYIIGGISSLGKTSWTMQAADEIARHGHDVLIFSLEMSRYELISKSISRITYTQSKRAGKGITLAKTARGITDGKRWQRYSAEERAHAVRSIAEYKAEIGPHMYIREGVGDIGVKQIREAVEEHIELTRKKPVVVVDYLQILAPWNDRGTDKQNADRAVLELKRISRDFKTPVIAVSSLNRQNYKEKIDMAAFKESGGIEYSSDVLLGLQLHGAGAKDFDATKEKAKNPREIELVVLKNRNGRTGGIIGFNYIPMFNIFGECEGK